MSDPLDDKIVDIRAAVEARKKAEEALLAEKAKPETPVITPRLVKQCLLANELGDGTLYAALHRGKFLFNKTTGQWLMWQGHHWAVDVMEQAFAGVEDVALQYLEAGHLLKDDIDTARTADKYDEAKQLSELQASYYKRVKKLRSIAGAGNCLLYSHRVKDPLAIKGDEIDTNPWLLACRNGVVDLRTGKMRPGRPEDYLLRAVPHEWRGIDCPAPVWDAALRDIFEGPHADEIIAFLRRAAGYSITGLNIERLFLLLYGEHGQNGKGTIVETLQYILGPLAAPVASEMLLDQGRTKSSSGPTPDIMALKGLRIAFASETNEGERFSTSKVKWFTGGDTLTGRNPHDKHPTSFTPSHVLWLLTNYLPRASADDRPFWTRMKVVNFNWSFVEEPREPYEKKRDGDLLRKLSAEASGILAWLVRGCLEWQRDGLSPPAIVKQYTSDYQRNEDNVGQFIDECCVIDDRDEIPVKSRDAAGATALYKAFRAWYENNIGNKPVSQKKFGDIMGKKGFLKDKDNFGLIQYFGIRLKSQYET
uniref:DNA primase n=1 Tax=Geobacter metallireducens TaxID=28232 RepID=A0A831UFU0_GEOME